MRCRTAVARGVGVAMVATMVVGLPTAAASVLPTQAGSPKAGAMSAVTAPAVSAPGSILDFARGSSASSGSTLYDLSAMSGGTPVLAGDAVPFTDPVTHQEKIFGISTGGELFAVVRNNETFATSLVDLSALAPGTPPLVGNPAPYVDPQLGTLEVLARATNGDIIDVAGNATDSAFAAYNLTAMAGAPLVASNPVPITDPQNQEEQIFGTSTGGQLFEVYRNSSDIGVLAPYNLSAVTGASSLMGDPAPIADPQNNSEQIDVEGTNGDMIDFARSSADFSLGVYDLTASTPGTPALTGPPMPFTDPANHEEQIFGVSAGGQVFEIWRNATTFALSYYDLSAATAGAATATGRATPLVDPQSGLEQIFFNSTTSGQLAVMNRSAYGVLTETNLTATTTGGQSIAGDPHPYVDPQIDAEQVIADHFGVTTPSALASTIATVALDQVGVGDTPASTSFSKDCNPYTAMLYAGYSTAGCGVDPTFGVRDENLEWCADFTKWVWEESGVTYNVATLDPASASFYTWGLDAGETMPVDGTNPQVGDAMVFYPEGTAGGDYADHVGIVVGVNTNGTVDLVNGDFLGSSNIRVEDDVNVSPAPYAADIWGSGEQWLYVAP